MRQPAVEHGRVADLAAAARLGFQQPAEHAGREQHAAAEVADEVERDRRRARSAGRRFAEAQAQGELMG